jgi:predicted dehydrogenase
MQHQIGVAIVGCGAIALANHLPGLALCPAARLVALCDADAAVLARAAARTGVEATYQSYEDAIADPHVHAVIITTPNHLHAPIALAAAAAGRHILCEKPLALNYAESLRMLAAAEDAGVRHMTAFTYRFVPAMRYMARLTRGGAIGEPYHFRACRLQDWGGRALGWRQVASLAGSGELGDMLSHRIDYGHLLLGPLARLVAQTRRHLDTREGQPADVEDWVAVIGDFASGASGVWESSKLAAGRGEGMRSQDYCEVNGSAGSLVYALERPHELLFGRAGAGGLETLPVPAELLAWPGSPRDPRAGDPLTAFRYDQDVEFINAILEQRPCAPSFRDGARAQAVMDAVLTSARERRWVDLPEEVER